MIYRTDFLDGPMLDAAVAKAYNIQGHFDPSGEFYAERISGDLQSRYGYHPSRKWHYGSKIIEKYQVLFTMIHWNGERMYEATAFFKNGKAFSIGRGKTHLIATMRAICNFKLGGEVEF